MSRAANAKANASTHHLSSSDQVVRDIIHGIYEGRFVAGQRLVEPDLVALYGVSRGTIREALKRLAAEGVVTQTAYRGVHIRKLSRADARDVLQLLEVIIGLAARLAAENLDTLKMRARFTDAYESLIGFSDAPDSFDFVRARNRFYRIMALAGNNRELARLLPSFHVHLLRAHLKPLNERRFADYRAIADAILAGNARSAEAAGRRHIKRVIAELETLPASIFAPESAGTQPSLEHEE